MELLNNIISIVEGLFAHAHLAAIVGGLLFSWGVTQWLKMPIWRYFYLRGAEPTDAMSMRLAEACHKWLTRTVAVGSATVATLILWPPDGPWAYQLVWAAAVGLSSPTVYVIVVRLVAKRWPWLAGKVSADAVLAKMPPPGGSAS